MGGADHPTAQDAAFDAAADELYALTPEEFTAARNDREKQAKADGDKKLAARVKALGKPNASAWLANQLVRGHPQEVQPLVELGEDLRAAAADSDGPRLRELAKAQRLVIAALVDQAKQDARDAGRKVPDAAIRGLVDTLRAAITDGGAARELLAGRLTAPLYRSGLESDGADGASEDVAPAPAPGGSRRRAGSARTGSGSTAGDDDTADDGTADDGTADDDATNDGAAAAAAAAAARRIREIADAATALAAEAAAAADEADAAVDGARAEVQRLRDELADAETALTAAETTARQTHSELTKAQRAAAGAQRRADR
ncbi:hypothetical protein [Nakamurella lactea]|uniref:hypothetical protein n=1 Tax=Nakamurella lactea TaxID=459515 RepID=UPI00041162A2|nr:hypothetical protein [Nakamurella lactea]